jgi:23S rRNA (uridine2479-2'-O)-methyltransferase
VPRTVRISRRNSTYQVLESLRTNRQKRHRTRTFLVEGVQPINTALRAGWAVEALVYAAHAPLSGWASGVLRESAADRYELDPELLEGLSGKQEPSELLALVRMPDPGLHRIPVRPDLLAAVMDRPSSPGNLGTLIRSCDAFGVHGLIVTGHGVDVYDPATLTASRGSLFAVPVAHAESHAEVSRWAAGVREALGGCQLVAADEEAATPLADADFTGPTVVVLGNETHGLSRAYREICDRSVRIPIGGSATSLNVSVAASIVLYEATRQRRRHGR